MPDPAEKAKDNQRRAAADSRPRIAAALIALVVSILAVVVRWGPRDSAALLAPFFYATPPAVAFAAAVLAWLLLRRTGRTRTVRVCACVAVIQLVVVLAGYHTNPTQTGSVRLVFWNVCSGNMGWEAITATIRDWDADIVGLAESNLHAAFEDPVARRRYWAQQFPDCAVIRFPRGMRLITRYPARPLARGKLGRRSNYGVAEVTIDGTPTYVVMVDLLSGPTLPRRPAFEALAAVIDELPPGPVLVMGDMNTPTESVHLNLLRERMQNAFEERGRGFYHTWPMPVPVLPLDQIWCNDRVEMTSCELLWTIRSDHRPVHCSFNLHRGD